MREIIPCDSSCVDKVKVIGFKQPLIFKILHYELKVWRHPSGLDRTQVISNDMCFAKLPIMTIED